MMDRRALLRISAFGLGLFAIRTGVTRPAAAQDNAARMEAASDTAMAFMKALRKQDIDSALTLVDAPFVAEDAQLLATKDDVRAYLSEMLANIGAGALPNSVLGVLDYEESRAVTNEQALKLRDAVMNSGDLLVGIGRDGISRGVLLLRGSGGRPLVVGVGY